MSVSDSLERLQGLYQDLQSLSESTLPNVERLWTELESKVEEFRSLLDTPPKNDKSRQTLSSGTFPIDDVEYSVNDEFKQETIQIADALNLDELEAAKLFLRAQRDSKTLDRSPLASAIILFHTQRQYLLECVRLSFGYAADYESDDDMTSPFRELVGLILQTNDGQLGTGSAYWRKCLNSMAEVEKWLQQVADRVQSMKVVGQIQSPEFTEIMDFQRSSLSRQHESLGAIAFHLVKANQTTIDDFRLLISRLKSFDKYDTYLIHYLPSTICSISRCASSEGYCSLRDARTLHQLMTGPKSNEGWGLRNLQAATTVWWLAEYSGRYLDNPIGSPLQGVNLDIEAEARITLFMEALQDGAFQFVLATCRDCKIDDWHQQLKERFTRWLLQEVPPLPVDSLPIQPYLQALLMEQLQTFTEAYITNMPDALRKLKFEEDEQRKQLNARTQLRPSDHEYHLERFLMIMAYAYEDSPSAAEGFWSDPDSNLFGFLRWASQRQATPRIAAFAELLRAVSVGEDCATSGHRFLLDEGTSVTGRLRKNSPLSWSNILDELQFYATSIKEKVALPQGSNNQDDRLRTDQLVEPETAMMLECFLRLVAHFCRESSTARQWFLNHSTAHIHEMCFHLCNTGMEANLKACAFAALSSLLTEKVRDTGLGMWLTLDAWASGNLAYIASNSKSSVPSNAPTFNEQAMFESIATGFESRNGSVLLLEALISPSVEETGLNDALPFPEYLGAAYRMPGIDPYVDYAVGGVFAAEYPESEDRVHIRVLRCTCLSFIATCLSTFNEDLIVFGNKSNVKVDSAMQTSSLSTYAKLHPFARVMEWLFNDRVLKALFSTAHQDISEVNNSAADSPIVLGLLRSIEVIDLVMSLQSTYFDIVRPMVKLQSTNRRQVVANSALASFEDAILNNLQIVVDLGLYCGSGHQELIIASLKLLPKLSSSRKLATSAGAGSGRQFEKSRIITALEKDNEAERISRSLIPEMAYDERELEQGLASPGLVIKSSILAFLISCLRAAPDRPTIAHLLMGFSCNSRVLDIAPESLFEGGNGLFHALVDFILECPNGDIDGMVSWLLTIKNEAMRVLQILWRSPLSATLTLTELRLKEFVFNNLIRQPIIGLATVWNGKMINDPEFIISDSAVAFAVFLQQRSAFFEYIATELRLAEQGAVSSLKSRIKSALLGSTTLNDGTTVNCPTIFDLVDFSELEVGDNLPLPKSKYFETLDYTLCRTEDEFVNTNDYNLRSVEQLLILQQAETRRQGLSESDDQLMQADAQNIILCFHANNQRSIIKLAQRDALRCWAQLVEVMVETCEFDLAARDSFILQILQMILSKLERSYSDDMGVSLILARLARSLIQQEDMMTASQGTRTSDAAVDRLLQLFRVAMCGIFAPDASPELRQTCSQICCAYIRNLPEGAAGASVRRNAVQNFKSFGDRLIEILCDDAYSVEGSSPISSLLLLNALVVLSNQENSMYIIESFVHFNFIHVIVDNMKHMSTELQEADPAAIPFLLAFYKASLSLLLRIAQVRSGAAYVLNAGLFHSIKESGLFNADPDIGLEMENPNALSKYFDLLLAVLRVVNTVVLSRGQQNDQTISLTRQFIQDCRPTIVSIFKRNAKIGEVGSGNEVVLSELVDSFTVLLSVTGFLESEGGTTKQQSTTSFFT